MAKLSHFSHTGTAANVACIMGLGTGNAPSSPQVAEVAGFEWRIEWPRLEDAIDFWFFGLKRAKLRPLATDGRDLESIERWARTLHLVESDGTVPEWVIFVAQNTEQVEAGYYAYWDSMHFSFASSFVDEPVRDGPMLPVMAELQKRLEMEDVRLGGEPLEKQVAATLEGSAKQLHRELRFNPGRETNAMARKRIRKAFDHWLNVQLLWCEVKALGQAKETLPPRDVDQFIRFQCEGKPIRDIAAKARPQDNPLSLRSTARKALQRVADRLHIPLRQEKSGRPKKAGTPSD